MTQERCKNVKPNTIIQKEEHAIRQAIIYRVA